MCYVKSFNKWWNRFHPKAHKVVIIEDFLDDSKKLGQYVKIWADRYNFIGESKGGHVNIEPGSFYLIITSSNQISYCFHMQRMDPIKRRFSEICLNDNSLISFTVIDTGILLKQTYSSFWILGEKYLGLLFFKER